MEKLTPIMQTKFQSSQPAGSTLLRVVFVVGTHFQNGYEFASPPTFRVYGADFK